MKHLITTLVLGAMTAAGPVLAESWTLDGDASRLSFGSVKKHVIGEVHHFNSLEGTVSEDGTAELTVNLASLETYIDIRNERMQEHVFKMAPKAMLGAEFDMDAVSAIGVGDVAEMDVDGTLTLLGVETYVPLTAMVARLSEDKVLVSTDMVYISTEELEVDAGIDKLMELASLPDITRTVPVTMQLVFTSDDAGS
ncbi:YceI family protein [Roseobacteraceae bacterium S113]